MISGNARLGLREIYQKFPKYFAITKAFWYKGELFGEAPCFWCPRIVLNWYSTTLFHLPSGRLELGGKIKMARVCQVTGKRPVSGNNVSHAKNHTKRRFLPNLQSHRFWVESEKRFVKLRVSTKGMRIIDKKGIDSVLTELRARGEKV